MKIIYTDGGELECHEICIENGILYADDIYYVSPDEIERIEED